MENRVTAKRQQLFPWLNRVFPPSSPRITQPGLIDETVKLQMPALPPSLMLERTALLSIDSILLSTAIPFPIVPTGKFWWVHAASFITLNAVVGAAGFAFILVDQAVAGIYVVMAVGVFETTDIASGCHSHATSINTTAGLGSGAAGGGGAGGFLVPQGFRVNMVTGATPSGNANFKGTVMYTEGDIGELSPSVS